DQPLPLVQILPLRVMASATLPDQLATLPALPSTDGLTTRWLQLMMDPQLDQQGMQALMQRYGEKAMGKGSHHTMPEKTAAGPMPPMENMENMDHSMHGNTWITACTAIRRPPVTISATAIRLMARPLI
ncbi:MAG: copper oxidase, partial [Pantoea agglomerans]|nr:copper oxidase [Pantoea agglomerans]